MTEQSGFFVEQKDIVVFIENIKAFCSSHEIKPGFALFKKLVVDIKIDLIADGKPCGDLGPFSVDLDAFDPDVFIHQCLGKIRKALGKIFVQPLTGVIFFNDKAFHNGSLDESL